MKATELRIGNLVHGISTGANGVRLPNTLTNFVVHTIEFWGCEVYMLGDNPAQQKELPEFKYFDLAPIKLTEKWLVRFGFEQRSYDILMKNGVSFVERNGVWHLSGYEKTINFVHELQNLYFALTGEELSTSVGTK